MCEHDRRVYLAPEKFRLSNIITSASSLRSDGPTRNSDETVEVDAGIEEKEKKKRKFAKWIILAC